MSRVSTFGRMPETAPPGTFRRVSFPTAALLDQGTSENWLSRKLSSDGIHHVDLPATISMQYVDDEGHIRSVPVGALHEITADGDSGVLSLRGWLVDTDDGHLAEKVILGKALHHNSIDIGDVPQGGVKITEHGDVWDDDFSLEVEFVDWGVTKTTLVATPAFKTAFAEIDDEILAALAPECELVIDCPSGVDSHMPVEIMAAMTTRPSWEYFNRAEPDIPHPIVVDEPDANGWIPIYGHLAQWRKLHRDAAGNLRHPPRGHDGYANYEKRKAILTDNGWASAGPITLLGGHVSLRDAANNVENVWADVHVVDGKHGPYVCGVMRPHIAADEIATYRARASQISGYWSGGVMRLIVSCVAAGYPVTESEDLDALVAAFTPEDERPERGPFPIEDLCSFDEVKPEAQARIKAWVEAGSKGTTHTLSFANVQFSNDATWTGDPPLVLKGRAEDLGEIRDAIADGALTTEQVRESLAALRRPEEGGEDFAFRQRQRQRELDLSTDSV